MKMLCQYLGFNSRQRWRILCLLVICIGSSMFSKALAQFALSDNLSSDPSSLLAWENMSDGKAWALLPRLESGEQQPLPNWAKAVTVHMPRTAAAMLELDAAQRGCGPLDPQLKAKLRWIIAHANRCEYAKSVALGDLGRTEAFAADDKSFMGDPSAWPEADSDAFQFVRLLTVAAPTIPDALFERLRQQYGDRGVSAMVLLAAYANFQDRLLLGLQVPLEKDGPLPPLNVKFAEGALQRTPILPADNGRAIYNSAAKPVASQPSDWTAITFDQLQKRLDQQRGRQPRLPIPDWDSVKSKLPPEMALRPTSIRWSLVTYGYAHELAIPWTTMTRTHWAEYPSERILEESLFWVQTRAVECNYCMGHCEMLLEVAGLDKADVAERTRLLAESDWSAFPRAEQVAYAYAAKLSHAPSTLTASDYRQLEAEFGPKRAMSIFVWLCRGLYMTRVSDGFQLPLERENVFGGHPPQAPTSPQQ